MKVLLRRNVPSLGKIGEVVNVKTGYARNYLIPQHQAMVPTPGNMKRVEAEKATYLAELAKIKEEYQARAAVLQAKEVTISARANEEGHLYGSVGPAQIAAALAAQGVFVDEKTIKLDNPIRKLDKYDVTIHLAEEVDATIHVWVVPTHEEGEGQGEPAAAKGEGEAKAGAGAEEAQA